MSNQLALLGGAPVRERSYPSHTTMFNEEEEKEVLEVLRDGHTSGFSARVGERFLGGKKVRAFEAKFSEYFGQLFAVSFNSATSALHSAVAAARVGPGDEVITTPFTMVATASAILMQNAIPVFADIEEETYCLNPELVASQITPRTKAIITVNLFGHPSKLDALAKIARENNLLLIEDNAQSPGAFYHERLTGTVGDIGIFSLNYHKAIQVGEGGVAITEKKELAEYLQLVRNHGEAVVGDLGREDLVDLLGWNYRLTELQAAIGIPQIDKLNRLNQIRQDLAAELTKGLSEFDFLEAPTIEDGCTHVFYLYPMKFKASKLGISRSLFVKALQAEGVAISEGYVKPIYLEPIYQKKVSHGEGGLCPAAERMHFEKLLTTNICKYPNTAKEVEEFLMAVRKIVVNITALKKEEVFEVKEEAAY